MITKWRLSIVTPCIAGLGSKTYPVIRNDGLTFVSEQCIARTDDKMSPNSGVHTIVWKIEKKEPGSIHYIGLCTNSITAQSLVNWLRSKHSMGWCAIAMRTHINNKNLRNGLCCGYGNNKNIFAKSIKFDHGKVKSLPSYSANDRICIIYDSYQGILKFQKNGQILDCSVSNLPRNTDFYWCIAGARKDQDFRASIIG